MGGVIYAGGKNVKISDNNILQALNFTLPHPVKKLDSVHVVTARSKFDNF